MNEQIIKQLITWILEDAQRQGLLTNPRTQLINYIHNRILDEGRTIKRDSVRRQVDRIIAYYKGKASQSRRGTTYMQYIADFIKEIRFQVETCGAVENVAADFLELEQARIYAEDITVLTIVPDPDQGVFTVYRLQSQALYEQET